MSRRSVLIAVTSLTLVVGLIRFTFNWLKSPVIQPDAVTQGASASLMPVVGRAAPDPEVVSSPAPLPAPSASRVESQASAVTILDRAYDIDSPVAQTADTLRTAILEALLPRFRESNRVIAEEKEVLACGHSVSKILKREALAGRDPKLDGQDPKRMGRSEQREWPVAIVLEWKTERELYTAFGGRVTTDYFGRLTAVGARAAFLKEQHAKGAFKINDAALAEQFWRAVDASTTSTSADVKDFDFTKPWWSKPRR